MSGHADPTSNRRIPLPTRIESAALRSAELSPYALAAFPNAAANRCASISPSSTWAPINRTVRKRSAPASSRAESEHRRAREGATGERCACPGSTRLRRELTRVPG